jgi:hypothetical protein
MSKYRGMVCAVARGPMLIAFIVTCLVPRLMFATAAAGEDHDPFAVVEIGGAGEWNPQDGGSAFGPTAAVEFSAIKNWLEVEAGVTSLLSKGSPEWDTDLVFKKPFDLSPSVEFEPGFGAAWVRARDAAGRTDSLAGEAVLDFMFWPAPERKFGWFLEPSYAYDFGKSQPTFGVGAGLTVGIP